MSPLVQSLLLALALALLSMLLLLPHVPPRSIAIAAAAVAAVDVAAAAACSCAFALSLALPLLSFPPSFLLLWLHVRLLALSPSFASVRPVLALSSVSLPSVVFHHQYL